QDLLGTESHELLLAAPRQVSGLDGVTAVAAGGYCYEEHFSLALKSDGTVWGWGSNEHGQLGDATHTHRPHPTQVSQLGGITAVAAGLSHALALKSDGTVWAWGGNGWGELGNGSEEGSAVPVLVGGLHGATTI